MFRFKFKLLVLIFLTNISILSFSQQDEDFEMEEEMDEEKIEKKIDPKIKMWYLSGMGAFQDSTKLDTLQDYFHIYHPVFKQTITASYVGNYGTPYINNDFFNRKSNMDYFFIRSREAYLLTPATIEYYNTRTPYTRLDYSQSENKNKKSETRFNVLHSQNVNPYWNFTFRYDQAKSLGQYKKQESKNNFIALYSSYSNNNLNIHSGFIGNSIKNGENGGLENDDDLLIQSETDFILNPRLSESQSLFSSNYFFTNGEYRFGKLIKTDTDSGKFKPFLGILYSFEYQRHKQEFIDEELVDNTFFPNTYYVDEYIKDSIRYNKLSNVIQIKQYENADKKSSFGKRVFLGQEFTKATSPGSIPEVFNRHTKKFTNVYAGGGIFRETGNFWTWNFEGKIYLIGRNIGQTELSGIISKPLDLFGDSLSSFSVQGSIDNRIADYFQEEFYSNHIRWKNDFNMEQRMVVKGSFKSPKRKFELGANYAIINNYLYNDTLGVPSQTDKEMLVLSAFADKDFNFRKLHFRTRLLWQKASNEELVHLPAFSAFISAYQKFVVFKVLYTQIGTDIRFNTSYYADAYAPSTGLFHLQNDVKIGDYPYIDAYASIRLKRTRLFFKMINIGTSFLNREYFTTPHYPMNRMTFRLGVSWAFYD